MSLADLAREVDRLFHKYQTAWVVGGSLLFLAITLSFIAVQFSSMREEIYRDYATSKAYADAQGKFRDKCLRLPSVEEVANCLDEAIEAAREPQRAEEDLYAQKQMAVWAEWMFYATFFIGIVSVVVASVGVFLVRRTLDLQRAATESASEATKAATQANELSRAAFVTDQRPWLSVSYVPASSLKWHYVEDYTGCTVHFTFTLRNTGKMPALNAFVTFRNYLALDTAGLPAAQVAFSDKIRAKGADGDGKTVFPGTQEEIAMGIAIRLASGPERPREGDEEGSAGAERIRIVGCAQYRSPEEGSLYQTGFIFTVDRQGDSPDSPLLPAMGDVPKERLRLNPWPHPGRVF